MKLNNILIENYRSIDKLNLKINESCINLIGLNESGKTNILSAIHTLKEKYPIDIKDRSKITKGFPKIEFSFSLSDKEIKELVEVINKKLLEITINKNIQSVNALTFDVFKVIKSLKQDGEGKFKKDSELVAVFDFEYEKSLFLRSERFNELKDKTILINNEPVDITKIEIFTLDSIATNDPIYFEVVNKERLRAFIIEHVTKYLQTLIPDVIFWQYEPKYLLPSEIVYDDFLKNDTPEENSVTMYNILMLCKDLGLSEESQNIKKTVTLWKSDSSLRRKHSKAITDTVNNHVRSIWKDYDQELDIVLEETKITIHIHDPKSKNSNYYEMKERSQGCKTFISFILTISAEAEASLISDFILLLDEPETHLHPSGVRFMLKKLLDLSKSNNLIFCATHSIFMIDRSNLKRHLIISKEDEATSAIYVEKNNIIQEEVIYEALGTRSDDFSLPKKAYLFEGDLDLKLLNFYCDRCLKKADNPISDYTLLNSGGTNNTERFLKSHYLPVDSEWVLILDNDAPGRSLEKTIKENYPMYADTLKCLFYSTEDNFELEDLLPIEAINQSILNTMAQLNLPVIVGFDISGTAPASSRVKKYKNQNKVPPDQEKLFEKQFKDEIERFIEGILNEIDKETTIDARKTKFESKIPTYYKFVIENVTN